MYGHAWEDIETPDDFEYSRSHPFALCVQCARCQTQRLDAYNRIGIVGTRNYRYPDGYRELGLVLKEEQQVSETRGQTVKRRFLIERGLIKGAAKFAGKPRERKPANVDVETGEIISV